MSAKSAIPENQPALFEGFNFNPNEYAETTPFKPWTEFSDAKKVAQVISNEVGPHVDVEQRDENLLNVIKNLARLSMLNGLQNANLTPRRQEIMPRYGDDYPNLIGNAREAARDSEMNARSDFRSAFGYEQTVKATSPLEASELIGEEYDSFQDKYWGPKGNKSRRALKNRIERRQSARRNSGFTKQAIRGFMHQDPA